MIEATPAYTKLRVQRDGACVTLSLAEPARKNPLGPAMLGELVHALDRARGDRDVRVIVLTGDGDAFSAGGDLRAMTQTSPFGTASFSDTLAKLLDLGKPTIARVPGVAFGGGLGLVAACDLAIACDTASFGTPEIRRGLFPMMIMAVLARVVPRRRLVRMMLLGETFDAEEAARIGVVTEVVPRAHLDARVAELAEQLAAQSPTAMERGLRAIRAHLESPLDAALPALERELFALLGTDDAQEGLRAFAEKREPRWTGR